MFKNLFKSEKRTTPNDWTHLKLWRKGYDNLRNDDGLTEETSTGKSVMHVIDGRTVTDLHVVKVENKNFADFEYYRKDGMIEKFTLRQDELYELPDFNVRARYIGFNDVELVFMAPRNIRFKRADAKEWVE